LMHHQIPDFTSLGVIFVLSIFTIVFMIYYYNKNEHKIIKAL